jgi:hypothetical protein
MTEHSFSLIPFPAPAIPNIEITGRISRQGCLLALSYLLIGKTEDIILPSPVEHPNRKDELWKGTCFEFFLAQKGQPQYWEFNMSPSGDWNVYRMDAYRRVGFREETSIQRVQFETRKEASTFVLNAVVDLNPIFQHSCDSDLLEIAITAIIQTKDGNETYWALTHPAPQADFHRRESFILELAAQTHPSGQSVPGG